MKASKLSLVVGCAALVAVVAALMAGVVPLPGAGGSTRPDCAQLPTKQAVVAALGSYDDLATSIRRVGDGVRIGVSTPCTDSPQKALVSITYRSDAERDGVDAILRQQDGFGVPVQLTGN